jgi:DNA repair protein RecO (recombination protein O)
VRQHRDEAYVLGTSELGEADLIVTLLAEHHGRVRGVGASARKSRRRFGGALAPMTRVSASWVEREGRELHRIESLEPLRSYADMQADPARQAACAVISEITSALVRDEQPEQATFRLLGAVLTALEGGLHPWLAVRYAEYWTLKLHGVLPDAGQCGACGRAFSASGPRWAVAGEGFLCARCPKPQRAVPFRAEETAALASIDRNPPDALNVPPELARPAGSLEALLRGTLEAFAERTFRSYRHLRSTTSPGSSGG